MSSQTPVPAGPRVEVIDSRMFAHCIMHPARGKRWTLRELAIVLGCSHTMLGFLASGDRRTLPAELAERFAEAVGCEPAVLFQPALYTESDTIEGEEGSSWDA